MCVFHTKEEGRVTCLVHGIFHAGRRDGVRGPDCDGECGGWGTDGQARAKDPGHLTGDTTQLIQIVEDTKFESLTDSGMAEDDSQTSSTSMGAARSDRWQQSSSKKRKGLDSSTPADKKPKKDSRKLRVKSKPWVP